MQKPKKYFWIAYISINHFTTMMRCWIIQIQPVSLSSFNCSPCRLGIEVTKKDMKLLASFKAVSSWFIGRLTWVLLSFINWCACEAASIFLSVCSSIWPAYCGMKTSQSICVILIRLVSWVMICGMKQEEASFLPHTKIVSVILFSEHAQSYCIGITQE